MLNVKIIPVSTKIKKIIQKSTNEYIEKCKKNEIIVYARKNK
jgi:hypothetical protein